MPFITEELWHLIREREEKDCLMISTLPTMQKHNDKIISQFEIAEEVVMEIRNIRKEKNIPLKESLDLMIKKNYNEQPDTTFDNIVVKLCNLTGIKYVENTPENAL